LSEWRVVCDLGGPLLRGSSIDSDNHAEALGHSVESFAFL